MPHDLPSPATVASSKWLVRALHTLHAESSLAALPNLPSLEEALPIGSQSPGWLALCHGEVPAQLVEWLLRGHQVYYASRQNTTIVAMDLCARVATTGSR